MGNTHTAKGLVLRATCGSHVTLKGQLMDPVLPPGGSLGAGEAAMLGNAVAWGWLHWSH